MKELFKITNKKIIITTYLISTIYFACEYGCSFALAYFATAPLTTEKIICLAISFVILYSLMLGSNWISSFIDCTMYPKLEIEIQKYYFNKIQDITAKKVTEIHTGYIYNLISDVSELWIDFLANIQNTILPLCMGIISFLFMAYRQSLLVGLIIVIVSSIAVLIKYKMTRNRQQYDKKSREEYSKFTATLIDFVQNLGTIRKLDLKKFCNDKIDEKAVTYNKVKKVNEIKRANQNIVFHIFMRTLYIILILSTISIANKNIDALPYLLFYMTLFETMYSRVSSMARVLDSNIQLNTAIKQLDDYMEDKTDIKVIRKWDRVILKDVIFSYSEDTQKIYIPEFKLNRGDKISIVGESGQGKTTAMNILSGVYPLAKGKFFVDDKITKDGRLDLVYVSQEVELFDLSIRDNLCLGKEISDEKILEMLDEAGLLSWYKELPEGLETLVGEKGIKLSTGQKQRLNLIRGILIDKDLYFFDEPTSNLDSISEEKITNMIEKYLKDKTYVIVTHRPRIKELCNKHYKFENHIMKEYINV